MKKMVMFDEDGERTSPVHTTTVQTACDSDVWSFGAIELHDGRWTLVTADGKYLKVVDEKPEELTINAQGCLL